MISSLKRINVQQFVLFVFPPLFYAVHKVVKGKKIYIKMVRVLHMNNFSKGEILKPFKKICILQY